MTLSSQQTPVLEQSELNKRENLDIHLNAYHKVEFEMGTVQRDNGKHINAAKNNFIL